MRPDEVENLYGERYAAVYDSDWQENPVWQAEAAHHVRSLGALVSPETRWLDVGCGTGWFLSQFPGVPRAGLDLSPEMLVRAREANPDALELRQASIVDDQPDWDAAWDVVSCTGQPWCYLDTMGDIERAADNLARWTAPDGVCFVTPADIADITGYVPDYHYDAEPTEPQSVYVTAAVWRWIDSTGGLHKDMIWPTADVWVWWMAKHFRRVDIDRWPHDPPEPYVRVPRRALRCSEKREPGDDTPAKVVEHSVPDLEPASSGPATGDRGAPASPSAGSWAGDPGVLRDPGENPGRPLPGRLVDQPLSYLLSRAKPWDAGFWRRVRRHVTPPRRS